MFLFTSVFPLSLEVEQRQEIEEAFVGGMNPFSFSGLLLWIYNFHAFVCHHVY